jgi:hypothetical protein
MAADMTAVCGGVFIHALARDFAGDFRDKANKLLLTRGKWVYDRPAEGVE